MTIGKRSKRQVEIARERIYERDSHRCIVFGQSASLVWPCNGGITIQHSVARGMGGSAQFDGPEYLRTMCSFHNTLDTANATFRAECLKNGWSIPRWLAISEGVRNVPVSYADGWFLLNGFDRVPLTDEQAENLREDLGI